jgi:histidyl-tRNA synthetase
VEHKVHKLEELTRWYYAGPMFRYERKQKGRYRQFSQIGAEVLGTGEPAVDAEVIEMVMYFLDALGIQGTTLHLNSIGCTVCREAFRGALSTLLQPVIHAYCGDCQRRLGENVLRILDCKVDQEKVQKLPSTLDHLCRACCEHFDAVQESLGDAGVKYRLEPHLVRGLDYYMRTAFEVTAEGLGAQNAILGGGRYDGLVAQMGGPEVPGFGFALGVDRLVMILPETQGKPAVDDLHVVVVGEAAMRQARRVARALRRGGLRVGLAPEARSVKAQMRRANKAGARFAAIIGDEEVESGRVTLRRLSDGEEFTHASESLDALIKDVIHARN